MISASKFALLRSCRYWARDDVPHGVDRGSAEASRGDEVHASIQAFVRREPIPEPTTDEARTMWGHALRWLEARETPLEAEEPFAFDPTSGVGVMLSPILEELGATGQRAYADPETWAKIVEAHRLSGSAIPMTLDLIESDGETATIYDWTTTSWAGGATDKRAQLSINALALSRSWGIEKVRIVRLVLTVDSLQEDALGTLEEFDFAQLEGEIGATLAAIPGSAPTPGLHCRELYCPDREVCPTTRGAIEQVIPAASLVRFPFTREIQSMEHASALLPLARLASAYVEGVEDALKDYARQHGPIPTSPGKAWGPSTRKQSTFKRDLALALLRQLGATEEQVAALTYSSEIPTFTEKKRAS
jgi:PD-(D/E)XK nuclease superfamily